MRRWHAGEILGPCEPLAEFPVFLRGISQGVASGRLARAKQLVEEDPGQAHISQRRDGEQSVAHVAHGCCSGCGGSQSRTPGGVEALLCGKCGRFAPDLHGPRHKPFPAGQAAGQHRQLKVRVGVDQPRQDGTLCTLFGQRGKCRLDLGTWPNGDNGSGPVHSHRCLRHRRDGDGQDPGRANQPGRMRAIEFRGHQEGLAQGQGAGTDSCRSVTGSRFRFRIRIRDRPPGPVPVAGSGSESGSGPRMQGLWDGLPRSMLRQPSHPRRVRIAWIAREEQGGPACDFGFVTLVVAPPGLQARRGQERCADRSASG